MDKKLNTLYELCEVVEMELEELNNKVGRNKGLSSSEAEWLKCLTESLVNIKCAIEKIEEMEGMSNDWGMTPSGRRRGSNRSMENSRRESMISNRRRNSYNSYNSYGDDAKMDFMNDLEGLLNRAPDEHTRMKVERMLSDLR